MINAIIADLLAENNFGIVGLNENTEYFGIFLQQEPKITPINCITIYNTQGNAPTRTYKNFIENEAFQIRVRSNDKINAYNKIKQIKEYLNSKNSGFMSVGSIETQYKEVYDYETGVERIVNIERTTSILDLGSIEQTSVLQYIYTINYKCRVL